MSGLVKLYYYYIKYISFPKATDLTSTCYAIADIFIVLFVDTLSMTLIREVSFFFLPLIISSERSIEF